jgi:hypothetical protein
LDSMTEGGELKTSTLVIPTGYDGLDMKIGLVKVKLSSFLDHVASCILNSDIRWR